VQQEIVESGAGVSLTAVKAGAKPAQRYDGRLTRQAGWEFIEHLDLTARAARYRDDAEAMLDAPPAKDVAQELSHWLFRGMRIPATSPLV